MEVRSLTVAPNTSSRILKAPYHIKDVAAHDGKIYAATSNGLVVFSTGGKQLEHWTALDGLPSGDLTSLAVDHDSLWIGTSDAGWIHFSNTNWTHFLPANIQQRSIHSLLATQQQTLLVGTDAGILTGTDNDFQPFLPELQKQKITSLSGDAHNLCIGTFAHGLYTYSGGVFQNHATAQGLQDPYVTDVELTPDGCYVSTPSGSQILKEKKFYPLAKNLFVTSFAIDTPLLWVATRDRGVIPFNNQYSAANQARTSALRRRSPTVVKKVGAILLAASGSQISFLDNNEWRNWNATDSVLSDVNVSSLLRLPNGELWIGYFDRGLDILSPAGELVTHLSDETLFCINHLSSDSDGRVYVSTSNGLVVFQPDRTRKVYRIEDGLLSDRVMQTLPLDPAGRVVAIATTQGFTLKEGEAMKSLYAFHGLVNNHVYTMANAREEIFLGTLGGISRVSKMLVTGSWTQMDSGLKRNWVNALATVDGQLFVGTYGSGIQVRTEDGQWRDFPALPQDLEINPNALFFDGKYLFCGTLDRGFFVYDTTDGTWKQVTRDLPGLNVTAFATDNHFLYVGTDRGLLQMQYDKIRTTSNLL